MKWSIYSFWGSQSEKRKISLTHVKESFNVEIHVHFNIAYLRNRKYEIQNIVDNNTLYWEKFRAKSTASSIMRDILQTEVFPHHSSPDYLSADREFCTKTMERFLL